MSKNLKEHGFVSTTLQQRTKLLVCLLFITRRTQKVIHTLKDPSWIEAMQEELLQFKLQEVWTLVDLPNGKRAIGTKWVFRNKKDERGIVIRNKTRLVAQGYTQEERIDYDEVFDPIARIDAIRLFLAYASFKDFVVYQMDVKSVFLYGKIKEEVSAEREMSVSTFTVGEALQPMKALTTMIHVVLYQRPVRSHLSKSFNILMLDNELQWLPCGCSTNYFEVTGYSIDDLTLNAKWRPISAIDVELCVVTSLTSSTDRDVSVALHA
ncbi:putative ribonuclease H-like domain-containing protein [Tanacetum coccineum]|uniref:Ribonuclease H-like domain-containing protein n=1 Tax=Tanacetum coccineum TaxID=301880 RepID=A0ABQ5ERT6_9ASTR